MKLENGNVEQVAVTFLMFKFHLEGKKGQDKKYFRKYFLLNIHSLLVKNDMVIKISVALVRKQGHEMSIPIRKQCN